jgi:hypothetical protein
MGAVRFDLVSKSLSAAGSRRGLLRLASGSPRAAALVALHAEASLGRRKRKPCKVCASPTCPFQSVQAAIDAASPGATIRICAGTFSEAITIDKSLTLIGKGAGADATTNTILDATGLNNRVVSIDGGIGTVTLRELRITGGSSAAGGGIFKNNSDHPVTLIACSVTGNAAQFGGGIFNDGGHVILDGSTISGNNHASRQGGGVVNYDTLTLKNGSSITGNTADDATPSGGGVYNLGTVNASGGTISGNTPDDCVDISGGTGCPS